MTFKIFGAIMVILGCACVGFQKAAAQNREVKMLEHLYAMLEYMQWELQFRRPPLPALCRKVAEQVSGLLHNLFLHLADELERQISPDVESCMHASLCQFSGIPASIQECVKMLSKNLGQFDVEGQVGGIEAVRVACKSMLETLNDNKADRLRSYRILGICAGVAIVIIFI